MASLEEFARRIRRRGDQVEDGTEKLLRKTFVAVGAAVVPATPVDTGRARGAWLPGVNANPGGEGSPDPSGQTAIASITSTGGQLRLNQVGVIANNVPYIGRLNEGSSKQAPANFVQKAAQTGQRTAQSTRILKR